MKKGFWLYLARLRYRIRAHNKLSEAEQLLGLFWYIFLFALYQSSRSKKAEVPRSFITMTVWKQHPRLNHKSTTGRNLTGNQQYLNKVLEDLCSDKTRFLIINHRK